MANRRANRKRAEAHVRLYRHELDCEAYRSLSTDSRALLVEFRALFGGAENRIHMSIRQVMSRLGVAQRRARNALDELLDRGFIRLIEPGGFHRKVRHATVYALTSEPLEDRDGAVAPKDFMSWSRKSTVAVANTDGSRSEYRAAQKITKKPAYGSRHEYR